MSGEFWWSGAAACFLYAVCLLLRAAYRLGVRRERLRCCLVVLLSEPVHFGDAGNRGRAGDPDIEGQVDWGKTMLEIHRKVESGEEP